mgnify:CR=1 FL=1
MIQKIKDQIKVNLTTISSRTILSLHFSLNSVFLLFFLLEKSLSFCLKMKLESMKLFLASQIAIKNKITKLFDNSKLLIT